MPTTPVSLSVFVTLMVPRCLCDECATTGTLVHVTSPAALVHRVFAFTRLNAHSSRSHAIVMLTIIKRHRTAPGQEEGPLQRVKIGKLFMVDLAGSERLKKSLSTGSHHCATCHKLDSSAVTLLGKV